MMRLVAIVLSTLALAACVRTNDATLDLPTVVSPRPSETPAPSPHFVVGFDLPMVVDVYPADGAHGIPIESTIQMVLSEPANVLDVSISPKIALESVDSAEVELLVTPQKDDQGSGASVASRKVQVYRPAEPLRHSTTYKVTIIYEPSAIAELPEPPVFSWHFTTERAPADRVAALGR